MFQHQGTRRFEVSSSATANDSQRIETIVPCQQRSAGLMVRAGLQQRILVTDIRWITDNQPEAGSMDGGEPVTTQERYILDPKPAGVG